MKRLLLPALLFLMLGIAACRQPGNARLLRLAEEQVGVNTDSVHSLLAQIKKPSKMSGEDRLLYGWLQAYVHYDWNNSMVEDSLILPAFDYYVSRGDTVESAVSVLAEEIRAVHGCTGQRHC